MRGRLTVVVLVLVAVALCGAADAEPVAPGVDATLTITPSSGVGDQPVWSRAEFTNTNQSSQRVYQMDMKVIAPDGSEYTFSGPFTRTLSGRQTFPLIYTVPAGMVFVPGSLTVAGIVRPDPTVEDNSFELVVTVPAAVSATEPGRLTVVHQLEFVDTIAEAPALDKVLATVASLRCSGGLWAVTAAAVGVLTG